MLMAFVVTSIGSIPLGFLDGGSDRYIVYPCAALQGIGIALMINTGTSLISDVIGTDNKSSAFVYGVYSLLDKFANGFLLWWLVRNYSSDVNALKVILSVIPTLSSLGCAVMTWIGLRMYAEKLSKISVGSMLKDKKKEGENGDTDKPIYDRQALLDNPDN